jgi:hypothetical protein
MNVLRDPFIRCVRYIHHLPGIADILAKLLVGDMYHVRCFNVVGVLSLET